MHLHEIEVRSEWVEYNTERAYSPIIKSYCYIVTEIGTTVNL